MFCYFAPYYQLNQWVYHWFNVYMDHEISPGILNCEPHVWPVQQPQQCQ